MKVPNQKSHRQQPPDYQLLQIRCPRCGRMNGATDLSCHHCGADLFKAELIRGDDYERINPEEVRKSCLWGIVPGLGLIREGRWLFGFLFFGGTISVVLLMALEENYTACLFLPLAFSIASVFISFLAAVHRIGVALPTNRECLLFLGRLIAGYLLFLVSGFLLFGVSIRLLFMISAINPFAIPFVFFCLLPISIAAAWLGWQLVKPFFGKVSEWG